MNYITSAFNNSLVYQGYSILDRFFRHSKLYKIPCMVTRYIAMLYQGSYVNWYLHSNHSFFTPFFAKGLFCRLVFSIFSLTEWFLSLATHLLKGSVTEKMGNHIKQDWTHNYIGYLATFLYTSLILYSLLVLLFGSGYTRSQMLILLVVIFLLFGLSQIKEKTSEYLPNSVIIRWIQKIYR